MTTHTLAYSLTVPNGGCDFSGMLEVSLDDKASWPITTVVIVGQNISQSHISTTMTATRVLTRPAR